MKRLLWLASLVFLLRCASTIPPSAEPAPQAASVIQASDAGDATDGPLPEAAPPPLPIAFAGFDSARRKKPDRPGDLCQPADENLELAEKELTASTRSLAAPVSSKPWDSKSEPRYLKKIADRYAVTRSELGLLRKNGFVVSARMEVESYTEAFHEIYQSELPIYVSTDAIFQAVYQSNDSILEEAEGRLAERLQKVVGAARATLPAVAAEYPSEVAADLDVYLAVADSLLSGKVEKSSLGNDQQVSALVDKAAATSGELEVVALFGRDRVIDFSQFLPRGHYAKREDLARYFRGAMWLSRLELNLVSRGSRSSQPGIVPNPAETPREVVDALALADLVERSGALPDLDVVERVWSLFAGQREDVSMRELLALRAQAKIGRLVIPDSADALRAAIGSGFQRTARVHYMPQGSTPLPVISTLLGPRIGADTVATTRLVHADVPNRDVPRIADVAFMLGHDRAKKLLASELARYPALEKNLLEGRRTLSNVTPDDLYSSWLAAIRELAGRPSGQAPSFMKTDAFADLRMGSAVAAYAGLRHNSVLMAGQGYSEGGCEIPEGFVEPVPAVYRALRRYAERGVKAMRELGDAGNEERFRRLGRVLEVLTAISEDELAGRPISDAAKRWLSMVVEVVPPSSDSPGSFNGWYFDLYPSIDDAFEEPAFIADWFTGSNTNTVVYAGVTRPRLGVFVVDIGGEPRAFVGPVARAFEHVGSLKQRLGDTDVAKLGHLSEPWSKSTTARAPAAPALSLLPVEQLSEGGQVWAVRSVGGARRVSIELLGHHRAVLGRASLQAGTSYTTLSVPLSADGDDWPERVRVRAGDFSAEFSAWDFFLERTYGGIAPLGDQRVMDLRARFSEALTSRDRWGSGSRSSPRL